MFRSHPSRLKRRQIVSAPVLDSSSLARLALEQSASYGRSVQYRSTPAHSAMDNRCRAPLCYGAVGFLQQAIEWVGAGDHYIVEEASCAATKGVQETGCVFVILKMEPYNE